MGPGLRRFARGVIGPHTVVVDHSTGVSRSLVLVLKDGHGRHGIANRHSHRSDWAREVRAYRRWVPALGPHAPQLQAAEKRRDALITTFVPGRPAQDEPEVHRVAGELLRRFHDLSPDLAVPGLVALRAQELERWLRAAPGILDRRELAFVEARIADTEHLPDRLVPCHHDYTSRNWLTDAEGRLSVIDFGGTRPHAWVQDLVRLQLGPWRRGELREAFLEGYGRALDADDEARLQRCVAVTALRLITAARARGWTEREQRWHHNLHVVMDG